MHRDRIASRPQGESSHGCPLNAPEISPFTIRSVRSAPQVGGVASVTPHTRFPKYRLAHHFAASIRSAGLLGVSGLPHSPSLPPHGDAARPLAMAHRVTIAIGPPVAARLTSQTDRARAPLAYDVQSEIDRPCDSTQVLPRKTAIIYPDQIPMHLSLTAAETKHSSLEWQDQSGMIWKSKARKQRQLPVTAGGDCCQRPPPAAAVGDRCQLFAFSDCCRLQLPWTAARDCCRRPLTASAASYCFQRLLSPTAFNGC